MSWMTVSSLVWKPWTRLPIRRQLSNPPQKPHRGLTIHPGWNTRLRSSATYIPALPLPMTPWSTRFHSRTNSETDAGPTASLVSDCMERLNSFCHGMTTGIAGVLMGVGVDDARDKSQQRIGLVSASGPTPGLSCHVGRLTSASLSGWHAHAHFQRPLGASVR